MRRKVRVSINLTPKVYEKAKNLGLNISKVCENALKEAVRRLKGMYGGENDSPKLKEVRAGFEPATPSLPSWCSDQAELPDQSTLRNRGETGLFKISPVLFLHLRLVVG